MSRVPVGKVLLRNVIRHTGAHNKVRAEPAAAAGPLVPSLWCLLRLALPGARFCRRLVSEWRGLGITRAASAGPGGAGASRRNGEQGRAECPGCHRAWGGERVRVPEGRGLVQISHANVGTLAFSLTQFFLGFHPGEEACMYIYL